MSENRKPEMEQSVRVSLHKSDIERKSDDGRDLIKWMVMRDRHAYPNFVLSEISLE